MTHQQGESIARRYVLQELVGKGGMGLVYRAHDRLTSRDIALKRVIPNAELFDVQSTMEAQDFRLALAREFKLSASLRHPHIVEVLDYGFDRERQPFFTMELLHQPKTLLEAAREQTYQRKLDYLVQMLYALVYLHRRGIIHHDLKPANVLVVDGQVKVLDFGLSKVHERANPSEMQESSTAGTLAYMAPEVLMGTSVGEAADLYAVGVMAFEMFANRHPYSLNDASQLVRQILHATPDLDLLDLPVGLAMVIGRLLHKNPLDRYTQAGDVIQAINQAIENPYQLESASLRESFLQAARLIGRDEELSLLMDSLLQLAQGQGTMWLIAGESGVGKSRLLDELRAQATVRGVTVMRGQSVSTASRPFDLWLPMLRWMCLIDDYLTDTDIGLLKCFLDDVDELVDRNTAHIPAEQLSAVALIDRLVELAQRVLKQLGTPFLVILEDLQWAGSESIKALQELQHALAETAVMFVASYRDDEKPEVAELFPNTPTMKLRRLDSDAIEELSAAMLGETGRTPQVLDLLRRETEGNVYFVIEVVRALAEEVGKLEEIGRMTLPQKVFAGGMKSVVQRRLKQLDEGSQYLLNTAAVIGREIDVRLMGFLFPDTDIRQWLRLCANAAVLEVDGEVWRFAHDKLREAVLDNLLIVERQRIHEYVATTLEKRYGDKKNAYINALAHHWGKAGNIAKEEKYATLAGERAVANGAYHEAISYLKRSQALLKQLSLSEERVARKNVHLYQRIGEAYGGLGQYDNARSQYQRSYLLCESLGDRIGMAVSQGHLGEIAIALNQLEEAQMLYEEALAVYQETEDVAGIARTLNRLGDVAYERGDQELAKQRYQESLSLSREAGADWGMAGALRQQPIEDANVSDSQFDMARTIFEKTLIVHRKSNNLQGMADTLHNLGVNSQQHGDAKEAMGFFLESLSIRQQLNDLHGVAQSYEHIGRLALLNEELQTAYENYRKAYAVSLQIGVAGGVLVAIKGVAETMVHQQNEQDALALLGFVLRHPQSPVKLQDEVESLIFALEETAPSEVVAQAWEVSKTLDFPAISQLLGL